VQKPDSWLPKILRRLDMEIDLTPEQFSQAFQCLVNNAEPTPELQHLSGQEWEEIAKLLFFLQAEQKLSQVH
jgi:hypothetical protein